MRREYYLHKRKNGIFYVEFINPENGKKLSARSTGETDPLKAEVKAELWKANGVPTGRLQKPRPIIEAAGIEEILKAIRKADLTDDDALSIVSTLKSMGLIDIVAVKNTGRGSVPFVQFITEFWDYDNSDYIRDRIAHGYRFSKRYAKECQIRIKSTLTDFFGDKKLNCITKDDLKALTKMLDKKGLATSTINQAVLICKTPLKWAFNEKIIPENPCLGLTKFSIKNQKRGILTDREVAAIFFEDWKKIWNDKRAYVASLVSAFTGARQGECLALRKSDIVQSENGVDMLNIEHSYSTLDGLKCPKNGETREVILLPEIKTALMDLLNENPHLNLDPPVDDPFIFYSVSHDKPCGSRLLLDGFKEAIKAVNQKYMEAAKKAKLEKPEIFIDYDKRKICFHSWRHWFCSTLDREVESKKVAKISGHLTESVFKRYASHADEKDLIEVKTATQKIYSNIINFRQAV